MSLQKLKSIIYDIITEMHSPDYGGDVKLAQNMGVSMTDAVKRNGVNIVQIQNLNQSLLVNKLIKGLLTIDEMQGEIVNLSITKNESTPLLIEHAKTDFLSEFLREENEKQTSVQRVSDKVKVRYIDMVRSERGLSLLEAANYKHMAVSTYHKAKQRLGDEL